MIGTNSALTAAPPLGVIALRWLKMTPFDHGRIVLLSAGAKETRPGSVLITTTGSTTEAGGVGVVGGGGGGGVLALGAAS